MARYDGLMMKRVDATHVAMDPDSVFPFARTQR